jgi:hypothetical protein
MLTIEPFGWRRLTPLSTIEHRLDPDGTLRLRGEVSETVPFTSARVRDGHGGFAEKPLDALGFVWTRAADGDGWILRTAGDPTTIGHTAGRWAWAVREASTDALVDERFLWATIACEVGDASPDASGLVRAPRTETGYPRRAGERDPGDGERDAEDWDAFVVSGRRRVMHSSHGLMQTLISTAIAVRPDLFAGVDPEHFRDVLANPDHSIACGTAYAATFPAEVLADPLASRFQYGAGSVRASATNRWGAVLYDEIVPLSFVAFWNDLAALQGSYVVPPPTPVVDDVAMKAAWLLAAFSCLALAVAASYATSLFLKRAS